MNAAPAPRRGRRRRSRPAPPAVNPRLRSWEDLRAAQAHVPFPGRPEPTITEDGATTWFLAGDSDERESRYVVRTVRVGEKPG